MKLQFTRLNLTVDIDPEMPTCLQIENRALFSRIVSSLASELGQDAVEPYVIWNDAGKEINPKKAIALLNGLPSVPWDSKALMGKLYTKVMHSLAQSPDLEIRLQELSNEVMDEIERLGLEYHGRYEFGVEWSPEVLLKAFGYAPVFEESQLFLDNCIRYFEMCVDVGYQVSHFLVNAKSFLDDNEVQALYDQAFFLEMPLVLLESWHDDRVFEKERKIVLDQHLWLME